MAAAGTQPAVRALSIGKGATQEVPMGIPNDSVTQNEIEEKRRQEAREVSREEERRKAEKSLDRALADSFPASDPPSITQPPPTAHDKKPTR
jgi:hypothetical protein